MSSPVDTERAGLTGQVAVVTGGGRGIGRAIALELAAGAAVGVLARSAAELQQTVELVEQAGGRACAVCADLADPQRVTPAFSAIEAKLGPVDLLVNNAGVLGPIGPILENDLLQWWHAIEVNLRGPLLCTRAVLPGMVARRRGRIIHIASGGAAAAITSFSSYVTGKTALVRFSECLAAEAGPFGVSVFAMSPGTVRTAMSEHSLNSLEGRKWFPWFRRIFDEGFDLPPEAPARLAARLASGQMDALSGLFLSPSDDLDALLESLADIERDKLYSLRVRGLPNQAASSGAASLAAIRTESERLPWDTLRMERTFRASREKVSHAWTDPQAVAIWFLPARNARWLAPVQWNARPDASFGLQLESAGKQFHFFGRFCQVKPPEKLELIWQWGKDFPIIVGEGKTRLKLEFQEEQDATVVRLTQERFPSEEARSAHEHGWTRCFDAMAVFLEGNQHFTTDSSAAADAVAGHGDAEKIE